jgi:hypothetical protein
VKLTPAQRQVLNICADHVEVRGSNHTDADEPCINVQPADRLVAAGLLERTRWTGRVWWYRLTVTGAALAVGSGGRPA